MNRRKWPVQVFFLWGVLLSLPALPARAERACEKPNMMVALDKSGSMDETFTVDGTSYRKWAVAKTAIDRILSSYGGTLRFGLNLFPSNQSCGAGSIVRNLGSTREQIMEIINATTPVGGTPLAATLMGLNQVRDLKDPTRRSFVMLLTDGQEFCTATDNDDVAAARDLYRNGIRVFVIGFGSGVNPTALDNMAQAGGTSAGGNPHHYYVANDPTHLEEAMVSIINQALVEVCDDLDNDCDGQVDENWPQKGKLCTQTQGACAFPGTYVCNPQKNGVICSAQIQTTAEICDGQDNDCDGAVDETGGEIRDRDGDGYNQCADCCDKGNEPMLGCSVQTAAAIHPDAVEICNGRDDDCDGAIDESDPSLGSPCGLTDTGECQKGTLMCIGGSLTCLGEVGPTTEVCDGLDNDCDGVVDENKKPEVCNGQDDDCDGAVDESDPAAGSPCGTCGPGESAPCYLEVGECHAGGLVCLNAQMVCIGEASPTEEIACDGQDNDCDGAVDENRLPEICDNGVDDDCDGLIDRADPDCFACHPPQERACGTDEGACEPGVQICGSGGSWSEECLGGVLPQPEACDSQDNDCDGLVDEGNLCGAAEICLCGECVAACSQGECPSESGQTCVEGWCVSDPCCGVYCPADTQCDPVSGRCLDPCALTQVQCQPEEQCRMGKCVPADCYTPGHECPAGLRCAAGRCEDDPCARVHCPKGQYCKEGECRSPGCTDCTVSQVCQAGVCTDSPCAGVACANGQICVDGECARDPCLTLTCTVGQVCIGGQCAADPCENVSCPAGSACRDGLCNALVSVEEPGNDNPGHSGDPGGGPGGQTEEPSATGDPGSPGAGSSESPPAGPGGGNAQPTPESKPRGSVGCASAGDDPAAALCLAWALVLLWLGRRRARVCPVPVPIRSQTPRPRD